jgi:hypothetical protein
MIPRGRGKADASGVCFFVKKGGDRPIRAFGLVKPRPVCYNGTVGGIRLQ